MPTKLVNFKLQTIRKLSLIALISTALLVAFNFLTDFPVIAQDKASSSTLEVALQVGTVLHSPLNFM